MTAIAHDWKPQFLEALQTAPSIMAAAKAAGIGHVTAYKAREKDPEFATAWALARERKTYEQRRCEHCSVQFRHRRLSARAGRFCSAACAQAFLRAAGAAEIVSAFWAKVDRNGPVPIHVPDLGPCWVWRAAVDQNGYGMYRHQRAHRFSYELAVTQIPDGLQVLHRCDNPSCVRPEHLFLGTLLTNMADRNMKERQARGERSGRARLTEAQVREARHLHRRGASVKDLARQFNVGQSTMSHACRRLTWRHLA